MQRFYTIFIFSFFIMPLFAQKPAYLIFDSKGKLSDYNKMLKAGLQSDMIFFGELHNNPIAHWLELEITQDVMDSKGANSVTVGMEMFETDQQEGINRYFSDEIDAGTFGSLVKPWDNYVTDYQPILELCKQRKRTLIATNVPRRYARMVAKQGIASLDTLPEADKKFICPLGFEIDYSLPSYKNMIDMMGGHGGPSGNNFVAAQAIKDATMAHNVVKNWKEGMIFLHFNGSYHSDSKEGIIWYVKKQKPNVKVMNISVVEQADMKKLADEHKGKSDFIIVVPETMTKTYR